MSRGPSTIELHPARASIERELAIGRSARVIAIKYGVKRTAVQRHKKKLPPHLLASLAGNILKPGVDLDELRDQEGEALLSHIVAQRSRLLMMQDQAIEAGEAAVVAMLSAQINKTFKLTGDLLGQFISHQHQTNISILVSPQYLELRTALLRALMPFPDARRAVAAALHQIEGTAITPPPQQVIEHVPSPATA